MKSLSLIVLSSVFLTACGRGNAPAASQVAATSLKAAGCAVSQSEIWNSLQAVAEDGARFPTAEEIRASIRESGRARGLSGPKFDAYVEQFTATYELTVGEIQSKLQPTDIESWRKALSEMEAGVRPTEIHGQLDDEIEASFAKLQTTENDLSLSCGLKGRAMFKAADLDDDARPLVSPDTVWAQLKASAAPEVYGARRVLATAYQSCDAEAAAPLVASTPDVKGIKTIGRHPAGGMRRQISSLTQVVTTDYYIANRTLAKNGCFEVKKSPLIYDFGGKPYTTAKDTTLIDMFKNAGSGESVLGIDCSAFVFSSLMAAGLKTDPSREMKGSLVLAYGSGAFKEPQSNNMKCLQKIGFTKTDSIEAGDIIAINGHVVMVDSAGKDPFGLAKIKKSADCIPAKLPSKQFDFVIAQSSPSKNGIGINRFAAKDYLDTSATIRTGLQAYAVAACRASFGLAPNLKSPSLSVVRHTHTPQCTMTALKLNNESCIDSCKPL